ncbi:MAG: hypothetical protein Q9222_005532 [Ikaeria aurantiellina]
MHECTTAPNCYSHRRNAIGPYEAKYLFGNTSLVPDAAPSNGSVIQSRKDVPYCPGVQAWEATKNCSNIGFSNPFKPAPSSFPTVYDDLQFRSRVLAPSGMQRKIDSRCAEKDHSEKQAESAGPMKCDKKRKLAALSIEEVTSDCLLVALDVVHPSELNFEEENLKGCLMGRPEITPIKVKASLPMKGSTDTSVAKSSSTTSAVLPHVKYYIFHSLMQLTYGISAADSSISNKTASLLVACNAGQGDSTCCFSYETCAPDLLCHRSDGTVRRQYCTDPTWATSQCSPLCPDYDEAGTILTTCNDGSYCCGYDNTQCCDNGGGTLINNSTGEIILRGQITTSIPESERTTLTPSPPSSTDSTTASATPSTTTTVNAGAASTGAAALPSPTTTSSSSTLSGGAKAGIAVGVIAGVALIAGLLFLLWRERRKRRQLQNEHANHNPMGVNPVNGGGGGGYPEHYAVPTQDKPPVVPMQEMGGAYDGMQQDRYRFRGEMEGQGRPAELRG